MGLRSDLKQDSVPVCKCICVHVWERSPYYSLFICCVFPSTVDFDCITSPKSRHFAQVSNPLYTNTETPHPSALPSPPLIPDRQLSLSLMFGRRRRAWCRRQAGHWWRLAPPYEGLYHQYYFFFFFSFHHSWVTCMFLTSADSDECQLVSVCSFSLKFYLFWFHILFHRHSHIDKGISF